MKRALITLCVLFYTFKGFTQTKDMPDSILIDQRVGLDIGIGFNSFSGKNDDYTKVAFDLGIIYELKEMYIFGLDFSFSPKEKHEETGKDGSKSTHIKWDASATCIEAYLGHKIFNRASLLGGVGTCFSNEFEVMKGYTNLTSYKRNSKTYFSPVFGMIYGFPMAYESEWYLKYDMTIGNYKRYSLNVGLKF
ncbi:MAG: hypothetical protein N4A71_04320 [Carboxylicivirga sp.]|jgi:opacity protein-like surface antigen|nr:hypothetical protein [Carboxylicivirga sp.]